MVKVIWVFRGPRTSSINKQPLQSLREAAVNGGVLVTAKTGESLEGLFLRTVEFGWHLDLEFHVKIPFCVALKAWHPPSLHPEITSTLCSGRNFHHHGAGERGNLHLATQCSRDERYGNPAIKIGGFPAEDRMLLKVDDDVEVTGAAASFSGLTTSGGTKPRSLIDTGRNVELDP